MKKLFIMALLLVCVPVLFAANTAKLLPPAGSLSTSDGNTNPILKAPILGSRSTLLYDQAATGYNMAIACQWDSVYPFWADLADNFTVPYPANVDSVVWWGGFWNGSPVTPLDFWIKIFVDAAGQPDVNPIYTERVTFTETDVGGYYQYTAVIPPFMAQPGTTYWVEFCPTLIFPPQWGNNCSYPGYTPGWGDGVQGWFRSELLGYPSWVPLSTLGYGNMESSFQIFGAPAVVSYIWDFEPDIQGWTHTNGVAFPGGWDRQAYNMNTPPPDPDAWTLWIDANRYGYGMTGDTALSPVVMTPVNLFVMKWGVEFQGGSGSYINDLWMGLKYKSGGVWSAAELRHYAQGTTFNGWDSVDVSAYASAESVQVYAFFNDYGSWGYWAGIDNIELRGGIALQHDVRTVSIDAPPINVMPNTVVNPTATFGNPGLNSETFDVYCVIDSSGTTVYSNSQNINIDPTNQLQVVFAPWTACGTTGIIYDITIYTTLAGDMDPLNDTLYQQTMVNPVFWQILNPPTFPAPTYGHYQASADDGTYIVFGAGASNNEVQIYDIASNSWTAGASCPTGTASFGTSDYVAGLFYRIGGWNGSSAMTNVDIYDQGANSWSTGTNAPVAMIDHMTGVYNNSLLYCFGGGNWYSGIACRNTAYYYDVSGNSWTQATSFPGAPRGCLSATVIDSFAIVAGGFDDQLYAMRNDYVVGIINAANPATITWGAVTTIPGMDSNYRVPCGTDKWNKEFYMTCGQLWGTTLNRTFSYSPYTDTWTEWFYPKPTAVCNVSPITLTPTALGDVGLFIAGGYNTGVAVDCHEVLHTGRLYGIEENPGSGPTSGVFGFAPNITNPTKDHSAITYTTTVAGKVTLTVYDGLGRLVRTLVNRPLETAGTKTVYWDGKDDSRRSVANGTYFIKLEAEGNVATHKLILVK